MSDNYNIRQAKISDLECIAAIYVNSWKYAYKGIVPQAFLDGLAVEKFVSSNKGRDFSTTYLLEANGKVVGLSRFGEYRDKENTKDVHYGEINTIYFLPEFIGKGYGSILLNWVINKLKSENKYTHCIVWVIKDNLRAQKAYKKAGFTKTKLEKPLNISGKNLQEVAYLMKF